MKKFKPPFSFKTGKVTVLKAARGMLDIFRGEGWDNWSRYRLIKGAEGFKLIYISGNRLKYKELLPIEHEFIKGE